MLTTSKTGIAAFIDTAVRCGMKRVVCSPGSRNAPLVIAIDMHPDLEAIVIHDERSAAFYALGMALQSGSPVGVVCTSGSAMLNYYPAVAEAYYQCVPLVVMSADRPSEWVNHGDGQTIVQSGVYENHILGEMSVPEVWADFAEVETGVVDMFRQATTGWRGPIHFNFPISEPMYELAEWTSKTDRIEFDVDADFPGIDASFLDAWKKSSRRMIICGQMDRQPVVLQRLIELSDDSSLVILVENTSNLVHHRFVHCIDRTLCTIRPEEVADFYPEVLISLGGAVISKRVKGFLRSAGLKAHCRVGYDFPEMDTYRALSASSETSPGIFLHALLEAGCPVNGSTFGNKWKARDYQMEALANDFLPTAPYSDLTVFGNLLDAIPEQCSLHMGNSSVVRYCQLFNPIPTITYRSNRGTSGIDGSLSTACGAAWIDRGNCHVMITGDVSFFYDSNALWSGYLSPDLRIVLINNGGGGIFRIIEGPSSSGQLERYFEAKPTGDARNLCKAFNVSYVRAGSLEEMDALFADFFSMSEDGRPKLMEIVTPSDINDKVLREFFRLPQQA